MAAELRAVAPSPAERLPPQDLLAEGAVISAMLVDPEAVAKVATLLEPQSFYSEAHRRICEAALALYSVGRPVDIVQVATWLKDHGRLEQVGGSAYLTEVLNAAPAVAHVEHYAETVARKARVRRLQQVCQRLVAESYSPLGDEDEWVDGAEALVHEVGAARSRGLKGSSMRAVAEELWRSYQDTTPGAVGIPTGLRALDAATGGLHGGEVFVLGGRPGMGKTALAMTVAQDVVRRGFGAICFSLEMPKIQLTERMVCASANVDIRKARNRLFDRHDWSRLTEAVEKAREQEHLIVSDQTCGLLEMRSFARMTAADMARAKVRLGLVVVDYVQLMLPAHGRMQREEAVSENARGLKRLAKEIGCTVLMLSQLSRSIEARENKRPQLSDFKESGGIEESADIAAGLYRHAYYHKDCKDPEETEVGILKQKHGPVGVVALGFEPRATRFYDLPEHAPRDWQSRQDER